MGHVADEADSQVWQHTEQCACHASSLKFMFLLIMEKCYAISLSGISDFRPFRFYVIFKYKNFLQALVSHYCFQLIN